MKQLDIALVSVLFISSLLTGCSGGGSSSSNVVGSDQQGIFITASNLEDYEGQTVEFDIAAFDQDGSPISTQLNCDTGTVSENSIILPEVDTPTDVRCEATATLSDGSILRESLILTVLPTQVLLASYFSDFQQFKFAIIRIEGPDLELEDVSLTLDGAATPFDLVDGYVVFLPSKATTESATIVVETPYGNLFVEDVIESAPKVANPYSYLIDFFEKLKELNADDSLLEGSKSDREALIDEAIGDINLLSENELESFASYVNLNFQPTLDALNQATAQDNAGCVFSTVRLATGIAGLVSTVYGIKATIATAVIPGANTLSIPSAIGNGVLGGISVALIDSGYNSFLEKCIRPIEATFEELEARFEELNPFTSRSIGSARIAEEASDLVTARSILSSRIASVPSALIVQEGIIKQFAIKSKKDIDSNAKANYLNMQKDFNSAIDFLNSLFKRPLSQLPDLKQASEQFTNDNASDYSVTVNMAGVNPVISSARNVSLTLFKADKNLDNPSHLENTAFDLKLKHKEFGDVSAALSVEFEPDKTKLTVVADITEQEILSQVGSLRFPPYRSDCGDASAYSYEGTLTFDILNSTFDIVSEESTMSGTFDVLTSSAFASETLGAAVVQIDDGVFSTIPGEETLNISIDRNTLKGTGTRVLIDRHTWNLDSDVMTCTYTSNIIFSPISCSSSLANCGAIPE